MEILAGLFCLVLLNLVWFAQDPGFLQTRPHPYLLVVLLIAALYGSPWGLGAALASSLTALVAGGRGNPLIPLLDGSALAAILTFFVAAVIVGQGVDFHRRARARVQELADRQARELEEARKEVELHRAAREDLQSRLVGESVTLNAVYAHARALGALSEKALPGALLELLAKFTGMEQGSVYLRSGDQLQLAAALGFSDAEAPPPETIGLKSGLAGLALSQAKPVTFHDRPFTEGVSTKPIDILAAPLPGAKGESPLGVIVIRRLPFHRLNPATRRYVALVCDWAAASLQQARNWSETQDLIVEDPDLRIGTTNYFQRRVEEEFQRARRYHLDLAVVLIRFAGVAAGDPEKLREVLAAAVKILKPMLRNTDILGRTLRDDTLGLILVATPADHVPVITGKISVAGKLAGERGLSMILGAASLTSQEGNAGALIAAAEATFDPRKEVV